LIVLGTHCSKIDWFSGIHGTHANEATVMKVHIEEKIVNSQIFYQVFCFFFSIKENCLWFCFQLPAGVCGSSSLQF